MDSYKELLQNIKDANWGDMELEITENFWETKRENTLDKEINNI